MRPAEAARYLGVSVSTLKNYRVRGQLTPTYYAGGKYHQVGMYSVDDLNTFIQGRVRPEGQYQQLLTVAQSAFALNVLQKTVLRLVKEGLIAAVILPTPERSTKGQIRIDRAEILRYREAHPKGGKK